MSTGDATDRYLELCFWIAGCSNRCQHCSICARPPAPDLVPFPLIRRVVRGFRAIATGDRPLAGKFRVLFYSDVLAHSEYVDILGLCAQQGQVIPRLYATSGRQIARSANWPDMLTRLRAAGVSAFQMALFGIGEEHDRYAGRRGAYDDIMACSEKVLAVGLGLRWHVFMFADTMAQIPQLFATYRALLRHDQEPAFALAPVTLSGRANALEHVRPTRADVEALPEHVREFVIRDLHTEAEWLEVLQGEEAHRLELDISSLIPLFVHADLKVHSEFTLGWPPEKPGRFLIGDLHRDSPRKIVRRYLERPTPDMLRCQQPDLRAIAPAHARRENQRLYCARSVRSKWLQAYVRASML
jgi:hypothetical protein